MKRLARRLFALCSALGLVSGVRAVTLAAVVILPARAAALGRPVDGAVPDPAQVVGRLRTPVSGVQFSADGSKFLSYAGSEVRLWSAASFEQVGRIDLPGEPEIVTAQFSPDSKRLLTAAGGDVYVWDAASGERVTVLRHGSGVRWAACLPDSSRLVTAADDDPVARLWNAGTGELEATYPFPAPVWYVAVTPDGSRLLAVVRGPSELLDLPLRRFTRPGLASAVIVRDLRTREELARREITFLTNSRVRRPPGATVAISPDGRKVATMHFETVIVWDPVGGEALASMDTRGVGRVSSALAFTADGGRVLTADGFTAHVWDAENGHLLGEIPAAAEGVILVSHARPLAAVAGAGEVRVWDLRAQRVLLSVRPANLNSGGNPVVAFSPDGRRLAVGYPQDDEIRVLELP